MEIPNSIKKRALDNSLEIKIKINQGIASNSDERKLLFETVSSHSESFLVLQRGNTAVFWSGE